MTTISLKGINGYQNDERTIAFLDVNYNNKNYDWSIFVPVNTINISDFLSDANTVTIIENQIQEKLDAWAALDPKYTIITDPFTNEEIQIDIQESEIVKPDIPDNYAKRRSEYPPLIEQVAALWKGPSSQDYLDIQAKIKEVKDKYPINSNAVFIPLVVTPFQAKAALLQAGLLDDVETIVNNSDPLIKMAWNEALEFNRHSPSVNYIASQLNWTEEFLDTLFINAYSIVV